MASYFDKDFFKFFLGFTAIICSSLIILLATRMYQAESTVDENSNTSAVIKVVKK